jgi:rhamnopyranosyl-N-acetylglucosaminyl-diphospho-decaprenol beta-1,3/1,4-galactofuranosyltransferase
MDGRICAIVVTYNRKASLCTSLENLLKQTGIPDKIVVVDNASTDGTGAMLHTESPGIS